MSSFKRTAKIKILDEVHAAVIGLHPTHIEWFFEQYGIFAPNYYFNPKYKLGVWDGKIKYFYRTGKTYVFLLDEIIPKLQSFGYNFELIDQRSDDCVEVDLIDKDFFAHILDPDTGNPLELRYYQVEGVNTLIENGHGIVVAGTGSGKTLMNAALVETYAKAGLRSITIVPSDDLISQTRNEFKYWELDVGEYSGSRKDVNHTHVISTWQALQNNPSILNNFKVVVVDECHGLKGQVLTNLLINHGKHIQYRFGLTGTLPKAEADAMSVKVAVGPVRYEIHAHQLIEQQYLAKMNIDVYQLQEDFRDEYEKHCNEINQTPETYIQFKNGYFAEYTDEKRYLQTNNERLDWIANFIEVKRDAKKGNVFCLVSSVPFGKKLAKLVNGAVFVHGKDKKAARKEVYNLFETHDDLVVIATVHIAGTGLNIKRIFNLMFIDVGKSFIRVIQSIGRGLRKAPDKDYVSVSDICSDLKYAKQHLAERVRYYKEARYPFKKHLVDYSNI